VLNTYDAIVVGGGAAGLTSAAYLCRRGCRTLLCEKSAETGGLVKTFWRNGFAFDAGIRAFENSGILFPMLKSLGLDIGFVKNTVSVGIGTQWARMEGRGSLHGYFGMLAGIFRSTGGICAIEAQVETVIRYMDVLYGIDNPLFLDKPDRII
jgi:phytoene dehydrogenase-like protein